MSLHIKANSGIMLDDTLDRLRGDAIAACQGGLPEPLVYYLRSLEVRYLDLIHQQRLRSMQDITWKHQVNGSAEGVAPQVPDAVPGSAQNV